MRSCLPWRLLPADLRKYGKGGEILQTYSFLSRTFSIPLFPKPPNLTSLHCICRSSTSVYLPPFPLLYTSSLSLSDEGRGNAVLFRSSVIKVNISEKNRWIEMPFAIGTQYTGSALLTTHKKCKQVFPIKLVARSRAATLFVGLVPKTAYSGYHPRKARSALRLEQPVGEKVTRIHSPSSRNFRRFSPYISSV